MPSAFSRSITTDSDLPGNSQNEQSGFQIPAPTWSIASLELEKQHAPVDRPTLEALAKRALIDLRQLDNVSELQQEVGNMMHMMNQVQELDERTGKDEDIDDEVGARLMYDVPRNVTAAPLRHSRSETELTNEDDSNSSRRVWDSFLTPKTQRVGGHSYFVIPTQRKE